jgi:hypothetical protein
VISGNRILSAAGAYLHGVCVAVLLQTIGFVLLILYSERWPGGVNTDVALGPFHLAAVMWPIDFFGPSSLTQAQLTRWLPLDWLPAIGLLVLLVATLVVVMTAPRLLRTSR